MSYASACLFPLATKHWPRTEDRVCDSRMGSILCKSFREKTQISKLEETLENISSNSLFLKMEKQESSE